MSKSLDDALQGRPWSVASVIFDLNDMLDDEGRPVSERRADAPVRAGVEMEAKVCPYPGIRNGKWMNTSALTQILNHYNAVMDEIATFRHLDGGGRPDWEAVLACVLDQLARPAICLLQQRSARGPVPAQAAVGHKLAAGFFGVVRTLHDRLALGADIPVTVDDFLALVDETGALLGAAEACAGSPQMIRKASTTLIEGEERTPVALDGARLALAQGLATQVQLGIFWKLYDRLHLWELIFGDTRAQLRPSNQFLARKLDRAQDGVTREMPAIPDVTRLPTGLGETTRVRLADALLDAADPHALAGDLGTVRGLLVTPGNAIAYGGPVDAMAHRIACYLHAHRLFSAELQRLEGQLRALLGFDAAVPVRLGGAVFPQPQAQAWYEMLLGCRIGEDGRASGSSVGLRVAAA